MNSSGDMDPDLRSNRPCPEENLLFSSPFSGVDPSFHKYDVFISFSGGDARHTFTSHLYAALSRYQIKAYIDETSLRQGDDTSRALPKAIEESVISIIVFTTNYASSTWCLNELLHILKCRREKSQIVLPIFVGVDPSDIRRQKRSYASAFVLHEQRFSNETDKLLQWRGALTEASGLAGWDSRCKSEADIIENVVKSVMERLKCCRYWLPKSDSVQQVIEDVIRKLKSIPSMLIDASSSTTEPLSNILPYGRCNITSWQKGGLPGLGSFRPVRQVVEDVIRQLNTMIDASSSTMEPSSNILPNGRHNITSWTKCALLGRGSFGSVYEGMAKEGSFFAVKEVSLLDEGSQSIYQLKVEIALLSRLKHENIVQYYGTHKDERNLYIFLELVTKGSLQSLYQKYALGDIQVSLYTRQILQGLKYLHDRNVIHRDIKCANILVDASGSVKLADFGLAKVTKLNDVKSFKGTLRWMAPEVVKSENGYGLPADIWSLGCTVLEMLTRKIPYPELEFQQAMFKIGRGEPPFVPDSLSNNARDFIRKCLQVNPDARATAAELLNHSFVLL